MCLVKPCSRYRHNIFFTNSFNYQRLLDLFDVLAFPASTVFATDILPRALSVNDRARPLATSLMYCFLHVLGPNL